MHNPILGLLVLFATAAILGAAVNVFAAVTTTPHKMEWLYEIGAGALQGVLLTLFIIIAAVGIGFSVTLISGGGL